MFSPKGGAVLHVTRHVFEARHFWLHRGNHRYGDPGLTVINICLHDMHGLFFSFSVEALLHL